MALKRQFAQWPWQGLLVIILLGLTIALWIATKQVNYEWRWERVPQYFAYQEEEPQTAPFAGAVIKISLAGDSSRVMIQPDNGGLPVTVTVETATLKVADGDPVSEDDEIGVLRGDWRIGPLTHGLWVTIWISTEGF